MAHTASEFEAAALNAIAQFPGIAQLVQAGDPRILAQIRAQAAMLGMISAQVDVAQYEPFIKARDATILADASLKGVLPLARAATAELIITNNDNANFTLAADRRLTDSKGRVWMVDASAVIGAKSSKTITCTQRTARTISHAVASSSPFYRIEVGQTDDTVFLNSLSVWRIASPANVQFVYAPDWFNVGVGTSAYQVETDELRRMYVQLGSAGVVGYQAAPGDVFELRIVECEGVVDDLSIGSAFNLEYTYTAGDALLGLELASVTDTGAEPPSVAELRVMARYPAIYDHNAVYLGEFAFLLRRYLGSIRFLAVWNEQLEEVARGPNVNSINRLFVAGLVTGMSDAAFQARATELISRADTSYKVAFVPAVITPVPVTIAASVSVVHDTSAVAAQIRSLLLANFGDGASAVSEGLRNPIRNQTLSKLLRENVAALQDDMSDFTVSIALPATPLPEQFLQVTNATLTVNVMQATHSTGLWSY